PEYIRAYEHMANLATRSGTEEHVGIEIRTPLIDLTKREIIELGQRLGVDYALTTSCYDPSSDGAACGHCDACQLRLRGFREAGTSDPARYEPSEREQPVGDAAPARTPPRRSSIRSRAKVRTSGARPCSVASAAATSGRVARPIVRPRSARSAIPTSSGVVRMVGSSQRPPGRPCDRGLHVLRYRVLRDC